MHSADFASCWRGRLTIAGQGAWSVEVWIATKICYNYYIRNSCHIFSSIPCWSASLLQSANTLWHIINVTNFYHVEPPFSPVPSRNRSVPWIPFLLRWSACLWRLDPSCRLRALQPVPRLHLFLPHGFCQNEWVKSYFCDCFHGMSIQSSQWLTFTFHKYFTNIRGSSRPTHILPLHLTHVSPADIQLFSSIRLDVCLCPWQWCHALCHPRHVFESKVGYIQNIHRVLLFKPCTHRLRNSRSTLNVHNSRNRTSVTVSHWYFLIQSCCCQPLIL